MSTTVTDDCKDSASSMIEIVCRLSIDTTHHYYFDISCSFSKERFSIVSWHKKENTLSTYRRMETVSFGLSYSIIFVLFIQYKHISSIALGLNISNEEMVYQLRQLAVTEIESHPDQYRESLADQTFENFLDDLKQDHHWAGQEALVALVNNLSIRIIVRQISVSPIIHNPPRWTEATRTIELAYLANSHYDLIVDDETHPKNQPEPVTNIVSPAFQEVELPVMLSSALTNEESIVRWLVSNKLIEENITCPSCPRELQHRYNAAEASQLGYYYCAFCDRRIYVRSITFLHRLHAPVHAILKVALGWLQGKEKRMIEAEVGLSMKSILLITTRLDVLATILFTEQLKQLGGPDQVVEIDEANMPRTKYNVGKVKEELWVLGMIQRPRYENEVPPALLLSLPDRSKDTLHSYIKKFVLPGTTIITDAWGGYNGLESAGFQHRVVCHKHNFVNPEDLAHTQRIESLWRWVRKRALPATGTTPARIDYYLSSFSYRRAIRGDVMTFLKDLFTVRYDRLALEMMKRNKADAILKVQKCDEKIMENSIPNPSPSPILESNSLLDTPSSPEALQPISTVTPSSSSSPPSPPTVVDAVPDEEVNKLLRKTYRTSQRKRKGITPPNHGQLDPKDVVFNVGDHAAHVIRTRFQRKREKEAENARKEERKKALQLKRLSHLSNVSTRGSGK